MTVITSPAYALAYAAVLNYPIVGWRQLVTPANVSAGTAADGFPAEHLGNSRTDLRWQATNTTNVTITSAFGSAQTVDYVGIARHNWGTGLVTVTVQAEVSAVWTTVNAAAVMANNAPTLWRFPPVSATGIRLQLTTIGTVPYAHALYAGQLLRLQRQVHGDFTPPTDARFIETTDGRSLSGDFLGNVALSEHVAITVPQRNLTPAWFREYLRPFLLQREPCFFAWRPNQYPSEIIFGAFPTGHKPSVANSRPNGMMDASFDLVGFDD